MICRVGDRRLAGSAVAPEASLDPARVARAVRIGADRNSDPPIEIDAAIPGPLHERVGCIHPSMSLRPRTALAAAARSLGWSTDVDEEIRALRTTLSETTTGDVPDRAGVRREVAETEASVQRLRERVAAARGRQANGDGDVESAVRSLSEAETNLAAARERRRRRREAARDGRDRLEARLGLRDRLGNLERQARRTLVDRAMGRYEDALSAVPALADPVEPFAASTDAMALAIARLGDFRAPVVVATGRFRSADRAADWLGGPVVHLET